MVACTAITHLGRPRLWRTMLAAVISFAVLASLLHPCCCFGGDEGAPTISVAQSSYDSSGKAAPCPSSAHCCHCLAHVTTAVSQGIVANIEYVTRLDRLAATTAPDP